MVIVVVVLKVTCLCCQLKLILQLWHHQDSKVMLVYSKVMSVYSKVMSVYSKVMSVYSTPDVNVESQMLFIERVGFFQNL